MISFQSCISCLARTSSELRELLIKEEWRRFQASQADGLCFRLWENLEGKRSISVSQKTFVPVMPSSMTLWTEENNFVASISWLQGLLLQWGLALKLKYLMKSWQYCCPISKPVLILSKPTLSVLEVWEVIKPHNCMNTDLFLLYSSSFYTQSRYWAHMKFAL